jgi:hypothetical protein
LAELIGGVTGKLNTTTEVLALVVGHPPGIFVTVTLYVPAFVMVTPGIIGFCSDELNPSGPDQEYIAPVMLDVIKMVSPTQTGELLAAVTVTAGPNIIET